MKKRVVLDKNKFKKNASKASALLKVLSNQQRLMILCLLSNKELSVGEIESHLPLSQSALSQHLARLRAEKIVKARKSAQIVYYSVADLKAIRLLEVLHKIYCE